MAFKIGIFIIFGLMLVSLGFGLYYLMVDQGQQPRQRLLTSLIFRVSLALILLALIGYGFVSGQLHSQAPW